jgi:adenosine deaminase
MTAVAQDLSDQPPSRPMLARLPKVELHRHLEGSLRLATMREIAARHDLGFPAGTTAELRPYVQMTNDGPNYRRFLDKFNYLRRFYLSPEVIRRVAFEAVEDAARDNILYLELRFTPPALAKARGFSLAEVTDCVIEATEQACRRYPSTQVRLIANVNRHEPVELAEQVVQLAVDRLARGIVAVDIGGDEVNFPVEPFVPLFQEARRAGLRMTIHAGEWAGPEAVRTAIEDLSAERIGHGVSVVKDARVVELARERGTLFEVCVESNLRTGVVLRPQDHPLRTMMRLNLQTTLNTDDPSIFGIALSDEYATAVGLGLSLADLQAAILTAARHAFCSRPEQDHLVARVQAAWLSLSALDDPA